MFFSQEILQRVAELDLKSRRNVAALLSGNFRSAFRGSGMQFKEFRHYEEGDDIRHMAWQVTARTGRATVKTYEEEREIDVCLLVDVSGSSLFGKGKKRKIDMYSELIALLGLAAIKSRDNVGVLLFNDKPADYFPPANTRNHLRRALTTVVGQPLRGQRSDLREALTQVGRLMRNRSLVLILSDFLVPDFQTELRMLARRHELVLLHCFDDGERGSLEKGVYEICDPETGELFFLDAASKNTRALMAQGHTQLQWKLESLCQSSRCDYLSLSAEDDYLKRLVQFFKQRGPARL